jgi:hypothetical protein
MSAISGDSSLSQKGGRASAGHSRDRAGQFPPDCDPASVRPGHDAQFGCCRFRALQSTLTEPRAVPAGPSGQQLNHPAAARVSLVIAVPSSSRGLICPELSGQRICG